MLSYFSFPNGSHSGDILSMLVKIYRRCTPKCVWHYFLYVAICNSFNKCLFSQTSERNRSKPATYNLCLCGTFLVAKLFMIYLCYFPSTTQQLFFFFFLIHQVKKKKKKASCMVKSPVKQARFFFFLKTS